MAVVVSHLASSFDALARTAQRQVPLSDLIELRLDRIGNPGEDKLRELISKLKKPVIVTVRGAEGFGDFKGSVDEQLEILRTAARAGAMFVDVDAEHSLELGPLEGTKCHRIVSRHEREGTPEDLDEFEESVRAVLHEGDLIKLVAHARTTEEAGMLRHLRAAAWSRFRAGKSALYAVLCHLRLGLHLRGAG
jgi:3-dehydroquinate dehydratase type I